MEHWTTAAVVEAAQITKPRRAERLCPVGRRQPRADGAEPDPLPPNPRLLDLPDDALLLALISVSDAREAARIGATCRRLCVIGVNALPLCEASCVRRACRLTGRWFLPVRRRGLMRMARVRRLDATPALRQILSADEQPEMILGDILSRTFGRTGVPRRELGPSAEFMDLSDTSVRCLALGRPLSFDALDALVLQGCGRLEHIAHLPKHFASLTKLDLSDCSRLTGISGLSGCKQLRALSLSRCTSLTDWADIALCESLEIMEVCGCDGLNNDTLSCLAIPTLTALDISGCLHVSTTRPLTTATRLQRLRALGCLRLCNLGGLRPSLRSLLLRDCLGLASLLPLRRCPELLHLYLDGCRSVRQLRGLERCPQLEVLSLCSCEALTSLAPLEGLHKLRTVDASGCFRLVQSPQPDTPADMDVETEGDEPGAEWRHPSTGCSDSTHMASGLAVGLGQQVCVFGLPSPLKRKLGLLRNVLSLSPPVLPLYAVGVGGALARAWPADGPHPSPNPNPNPNPNTALTHPLHISRP